MNHHLQQQNSLSAAFARTFAPEIDAWHGNASLAPLFWFYGVLTSAMMIVLYIRLIYLHLVIAEQLLLIAFGLYTVWILVSIWRCSLTSGTYWAQLARFLTVAWAGNAVLVLLFRQLELLSLFAGISASG